MGRFSVLVFGPESVSYERSRGIRRWVLREISARVFLRFPKNVQNVQKSKFWGKNKIRIFREKSLKNLKISPKLSWVHFLYAVSTQLSIVVP